MKIFPAADLDQLTDPAHPVFKAVEKEFNDWYDDAPSYQREAYEGYGDDPPPCNKRGAIEDAIEGMIDEANATGKPVTVSLYDTAQHFQA